MDATYDVIIIGSGPAGLTSGLYTSRARFNTLIIEKEVIGGELMNRDLIENYPGFSDGVLGPDLASNMIKQVKNYGVKIVSGAVEQIEVEGNRKTVTTAQGKYSANNIIVASGSRPKKLGVPGEQEFADIGVFYCATCDGPGFADKVVAVIGGGDSGMTEALFLSRFVSKVIVIELLPYFAANKTLQDRVSTDPKIETMCGVKIEAIKGEGQVQSINILDSKTGEKNSLEVEGVFIRVGIDPNTEFAGNILPLNDRGLVIVDESLETEIKGIFAAGDVRINSPMQISTAVGDGATAALSLERRSIKE